MSAKAVLQRWSRETITWEPRTGSDPHGQGIYGPPVSLRGRVDYYAGTVRSETGEAIESDTQVYLATAYEIKAVDRITLPDGTQPIPMRIDRLADHQGERWLVHIFFRTSRTYG